MLNVMAVVYLYESCVIAVFVGERETEAFASTFDVPTGPFILKFGFKGVKSWGIKFSLIFCVKWV